MKSLRVAQAVILLLAATSAAPARAIIAGTPDTTRPDVMVLRDDGSTLRCTVTLIAPNLVVTARHCVGKTTGSTQLCRGDATDDGAQSLPVYSGNVAAAPLYVAATPSTAAVARVLAIHDDGATTTCGHDVAFLQLDRAVPGIVPAKIRRTPAPKGTPLTVMGYGWIDRAATINATERMKGTASVLGLGPVVYIFKPFDDGARATDRAAIAAGEIAVTGISASGDSGGPGFDAAGELAAIVARGYPDPAYGPGTMTTMAAHLATIDSALVASGNPPLPPVDAGADAGPAADAGANADAGAGTGADAAAAADAGAGAAADPGDDGSGGCAATSRPLPSSSSSTSTAALAVLGLALTAGALVRRSAGGTRRARRARSS